jgi:hypothetical protein
MIVQTYLKAVQTVTILDPCQTRKSIFFSKSEWHLDGVAESSGRMHWSIENLLDTREHLDGIKSLSGHLQGIQLLLSGICAKSYEASEIAFLKLVTLTVVINRHCP